MIMEFEAFAGYIKAKKEDLRRLKVDRREFDIPYSRDMIYSIIGGRRTGKTYAIYDLILNKLKLEDDEFLFMNLEDIELENITAAELADTVNLHQQLYGKLPDFVIFDEVQSLDGWERPVYSLFEKKRYNILLTGSSSRLLSKEIATELRGRSLTFSVYTLSFGEALAFSGMTPSIGGGISSYEKNKLGFRLNKYLSSGGFPDIVLDDKIADRFLREYIDLVIFKDIVERHGIKNTAVVRFLINAILSSYAKEFSVNNVYRQLKNDGIRAGRKAVYAYSALVQDAFFSFFVKKFYFSKRKSDLSIPKVYLNDTGLAKLAVMAGEDMGRLMENAVFLELKRIQNRNPNIEIYYYSSTFGEVDFVLKEGGALKKLIQVTYASKVQEIREREARSLLSAAEELKCKDLLIITWGYEGSIRSDKRAIRLVPLWKWLLESNLESAAAGSRSSK
jgi:predicted AAA+ superfamily ATPase